MACKDAPGAQLPRGALPPVSSGRKVCDEWSGGAWVVSLHDSEGLIDTGHGWAGLIIMLMPEAPLGPTSFGAASPFPQ